MIRSIITVAALGFALAGCTPGTANETPVAPPAPAVAPVIEPAPVQQDPEPAVVEQAPAVQQPQQSPALTCEPNADARFDPNNPHVIVNKSCGYTDANGQERSHNPWIDDQLDQARQNEQIQQMTDNIREQQNRNIEQVNEQMNQQFPNMPAIPTVSPGEAGYEEQMNAYRGEIDEYMCAEGNAYTVPSNVRSC